MTVRRTPSIAALVTVLAALLLAGCSATGGGETAASPDSERTTTTTTTEVEPPEGMEFEKVGRILEDGELDRSIVREEASDLLRRFEGATPDQTDCYTDHLISELGLARLQEMGVGTVSLTSGSVLDAALESEHDAIGFMAPMFDCLDMRPKVMEDLGDVPVRARDCVADRVLDDRAVRIVFVYGTRKGSDPDPEMEAMMDPLLRRLFAIEAECIAGG
jgi:hypothetical protein